MLQTVGMCQCLAVLLLTLYIFKDLRGFLASLNISHETVIHILTPKTHNPYKLYRQMYQGVRTMYV